MTWDFEWNLSNEFNCRSKICHKPFFDGLVEPNVTRFASTCQLKEGEVCVKQVIYDVDGATPTFISRSCGRGVVANDGSRSNSSCHVDKRRKDRIVEVCFCNDGDKCNSGVRSTASLAVRILSLLLLSASLLARRV